MMVMPGRSAMAPTVVSGFRSGCRVPRDFNTLPEGPALLAWARADAEYGCLKMTEKEGLETLFGLVAARIVAKPWISLDPASRLGLL